MRNFKKIINTLYDGVVELLTFQGNGPVFWEMFVNIFIMPFILLGLLLVGILSIFLLPFFFLWKIILVAHNVLR